MQIGDSIIWEQVVESDSIMTEIEVTTQNSGGFEAVRDAFVDEPEVLVSLKGIPSGGAMYTNKQKINIRENEKGTKHSPRNKNKGKTEEAGSKKRFANAQGGTSAVPVLRNAPKTHMRMCPLSSKGLAFEIISMHLKESSDMVAGKNTFCSIGF